LIGSSFQYCELIDGPPAGLQLREEFGARHLGAREPPPKWSLLGVNKRPELIERRRRELEVWLWKLIADPEVARSRPLNTFLELSEAARTVPQCVA
jgi:PX domain